MAKKTWVQPMTLVQKFEANETVAAEQCWYVGCNTGWANSIEREQFTWTTVHLPTECGQDTKHVLKDTDGDGFVDTMIENKAGGLVCTLYTDSTYSTPMDFDDLKPDTRPTIFWTTFYKNKTYHHVGQINTVTDPAHPNKS